MKATPVNEEPSVTTQTKVARLEVTADPAESMAIGDQIFFRDVDPLWVDLVGGVKSVGNWEIFRGAMLAVGFGTPERVKIEGSAVVVAPGVALCAWHVIEPYQTALASGAIGCFAFGVTGARVQYWRLRTSTPSSSTDIAILGFELGSALAAGDTLFKFPLSARIPKPGDSLMLCGFRAAREVFDHSETDDLRVDVLVSTGTISQCFMKGRDTSSMPWPALEISCPSLGGMSGGPVFDKTGHVVGLVTSSIAPSNEPTYASLIWPALVTKFTGGWPAPLFAKPQTLLELGPLLCSIDGREHVTLSVDANGSPMVSVFVPD